MTDYERIKSEFDLSLLQKDRLVSKVYPVGSIYMSINEVSPSDLFGGVWDRIQNAFLLAASNSHPAGETGGEETHTLTEDEMPKHTHVHNDYIDGYVDVNYRTGIDTYETPCRKKAGGDRQAVGGRSSSTGGDQPHNNMPPYIAVYVWVRIK